MSRVITIDYPEAQIINLKNNYRSTGTIVNASNQMIDSYNIVSAFDKPHEKITIHAAPTDKAESEFIVKTIEGLIGGHNFFSIDTERAFNEDNNFSFSDFAILYRSSSQLKPLTEALERSGMPFINLSNNLLCDNKNIKADMKKMNILCIIASIILFTGCNTTKKEKEVSTKDPEMEDVDAMVDVTVPAKKVTDRDFSVTSENAYNDMFLDSLAMDCLLYTSPSPRDS